MRSWNWAVLLILRPLRGVDRDAKRQATRATILWVFTLDAMEAARLLVVDVGGAMIALFACLLNWLLRGGED
jgi:hypothetical protein